MHLLSSIPGGFRSFHFLIISFISLGDLSALSGVQNDIFLNVFSLRCIDFILITYQKEEKFVLRKVQADNKKNAEGIERDFFSDLLVDGLLQ